MPGRHSDVPDLTVASFTNQFYGEFIQQVTLSFVRALLRGAAVQLVQATLGQASVGTAGRYLHARPPDSSARTSDSNQFRSSGTARTMAVSRWRAQHHCLGPVGAAYAAGREYGRRPFQWCKSFSGRRQQPVLGE